MDAERKRAYQILLAAGMLHMKWDLVNWYGRAPDLFNPWRFFSEARRVRRAAYRSAAFHNLAIFATHDFSGFSEDEFWEGIEKFQRDFPENNWENYRGMFERCLKGEIIEIIRPGG